MRPIRLITLAPGHFHAALVQKQMPPGVHRRSHVYGPLDHDTCAHIDRIVGFNARPDSPTDWELDLRASPDWLGRFQREQPGNAVVLSGRNRPKIDLMEAAVSCSLNVLADKPWIIDFSDFTRLDELLRDAELRDDLVWDVMTERHEMTNQLMRELVRDRSIFGQWRGGSPEQPALVLESVHHLKKRVAGRPLLRPWWWFDAAISGESMADVGTHLADLAIGLIAQEAPVDFQSDISLSDADRWPLILDEEQFRDLTGLPGYPPELASRLVEGQLYYAGNNSVTLVLRGVHVKLTTRWEFTAPPGGGDTHTALALGTKATIAIRQQPDKHPEVFVIAATPRDHGMMLDPLHARCAELTPRFPGLGVENRGNEVRLLIPEDLRTGHEAHFASVMDEYVRYFHTPRAVPPWERPNLLAKYFITTRAVEMAIEKRPGL